MKKQDPPIERDLYLSLEEVFHGCTKKMKISRRVFTIFILEHSVKKLKTKECKYISLLSRSLFVCLIYVRFCQLWVNWMSQSEGSGYRGTWAMSYSFSKEWFHYMFSVQNCYMGPWFKVSYEGYGPVGGCRTLKTPDLTVQRTTPRQRSAGIVCTGI